jgi:hypothetical protein
MEQLRKLTSVELPSLKTDKVDVTEKKLARV